MQRILDAAAVGLSALCFVHCLILPIAALSLPLLGAFGQAEYVHWLFLAIAAPIAAAVFGPALRERPLPLLLPGLAALGITLLLTGALDVPNHFWGTAFTVAGGFTVAGAHLLNWRRRHVHGHAAPAQAPL